MAWHVDGSALRGLTEPDRALFRGFGFGPLLEPPWHRIHHGFVQWARRCPDAVAVTHQGAAMSYGELDRQSDRLAALLVAHGVRPGDCVGLFVRRSVPMVVGILGVLKAGAAYVPQDVRITPAAHLGHIVRTARTRVVLTLSEYVARIPDSPGQVLVELDTFLATPSHTVPAPRVRTGETAVVIFTSGTTGSPNGVRVTHANLCNALLVEPGSLGVRPGMRVSQVLNIAFDMAVWEIFCALSHGATLVIRGSDIEETVRAVDVVIATPSILGSLDASRCRNVRVAAVAGERCPVALARTWSAFCAFHNSCGPTEVTIVNTLVRYRGGQELTIGRPLPNTTVYVLDGNLRPLPIGEVGEMWAGGACVTAGYLGNHRLTVERYRPDPFLGGGRRMFRTRDLGRWTATGELEHHGRTDDQVKVHGFRVELDAVTSALELVPGVRQATTVLRDGELVAFVAPAGLDGDEVARSVAGRLPYYCVPSLVVPVDALPMTARGKVDKGMLVAGLERGLGSAAQLIGAVA